MPKTLRGMTELEYAEQHLAKSEQGLARWREVHPDEPDTSWVAMVDDARATLELRRAGDMKTTVRTATHQRMREIERATYNGKTWAESQGTAPKPHTTPLTERSSLDPASILAMSNELGRKFEPGDVTDELYEYAVKWLAEKPQPISFEYLKSLREQLDEGQALSVPQAKGVLNCILADARRSSSGSSPAPGVIPTAAPGTPGPTTTPQRAALSPGIYALTEGGGASEAAPAIFKVQAAVHGSNHLYAKRLVADGTGLTKGRFEYEKGAISKLREEDRLSLADAKKYGAIYGVCIVCGALLTDEDSIANGIGPVCAGKV